ncbi:MAG: methyltransferase domain-containing protein [Deltaproteobacteria bacterium]|nr:methyltransferase domain-containing protein [Deltaproteobacteria bacterium]
MNTALLSILRSPIDHRPLSWFVEDRSCLETQDVLLSQTGYSFPVQDGIPTFAEPREGQLLRDELLSALTNRVRDEFWDTARGELLSELEIRPGERVLEVTVGSGVNLRQLPRDAHCVGLDLSARTLLQCQKNLARWSVNADLVQGRADRLPFRSDSFDIAFCLGGVQLSENGPGAVLEMLRVTRPGGRVLVIDATDWREVDLHQRMLNWLQALRGGQDDCADPSDLVPPEGVADVETRTLHGGRHFLIRIRKQAAG